MWVQHGRGVSHQRDLDSVVDLGPAADLGPVAAISPSRARRSLDIVVALLVLGVSLPLLLALVLAVRLSTGGSAIYRQRRVGEAGVPFTLYKFRTMRPGVAGPEVTAPGDHRITRLGSVLRRSSVDEVLQMVNVLRGHMTLVGPRPESVALARRYPAEFRSIFRYRPGVTGPSQILARDEKVLRQVSDVEEFYLTELVPHRVAMDLTFLEDATLASTVHWLAETGRYLIAVIRPKTAGAHTAALSPGALTVVAEERKQ